MQNFDQLTEDYSRHRVPDSITVSGLKITVVLVGAIITLPVFLVGAQLANALGLKQAIVAFFIAGIALSVIAGATGVLAARTRLTTWIIIRYSFGHAGARIVSAFIGITVLGWYGATVDMFARAVEIIVVGFAGTLIAMLPILDNFLYFLKFLAFMIPPVAGVYLADYFWLHKQRYTDEELQRTPRYNPAAFLAWILGSLTGYLSDNKMIEFTTVPAVDAIVIGFSLYVFLSYISVKTKSLFNKAKME